MRFRKTGKIRFLKFGAQFDNSLVLTLRALHPRPCAVSPCDEKLSLELDHSMIPP